jgi:protein-tyrosine phosphatase
MLTYPLTWITSHLAVGHAPMSYDELDSIKSQGIDAIVNLCGEFSDLHEIEESAGFEVFFLPIDDENAPKMAEMEEGLAWLDEAVYLGKKVLVHCRHGIGRTGTFVTAYLLRRGFSLKKAAKLLKKMEARANPTNFSQWWLLRKFGKKEGQLTLHEPDPQNRKHDELTPFFRRYELLLGHIDASVTGGRALPDDARCCRHDTFEISLIEALYLHTKAGVTLSAKKRKELLEPYNNDGNDCTLFLGEDSPLHPFRPASCRLMENTFPESFAARIEKDLAHLSQEVFAAVFSIGTDAIPPPVQIDEVISGRFIQRYFQLLAAYKTTTGS